MGGILGGLGGIPPYLGDAQRLYEEQRTIQEMMAYAQQTGRAPQSVLECDDPVLLLLDKPA
jgi:hypothetical protein